MPLEDADWERAPARSRRSSLPFPRARTARAGLLAIGVTCAVLSACGDDGTEGLSSCPDYKIVLNKNNELVCAPPEKKTGASTAANTGAKPPVSSSAAGAANSGSAGSARP